MKAKSPLNKPIKLGSYGYEHCIIQRIALIYNQIVILAIENQNLFKKKLINFFNRNISVKLRYTLLAKSFKSIVIV